MKIHGVRDIFDNGEFVTIVTNTGSAIHLPMHECKCNRDVGKTGNCDCEIGKHSIVVTISDPYNENVVISFNQG